MLLLLGAPAGQRTFSCTPRSRAHPWARLGPTGLIQGGHEKWRSEQQCQPSHQERGQMGGQGKAGPMGSGCSGTPQGVKQLPGARSRRGPTNHLPCPTCLVNTSRVRSLMSTALLHSTPAGTLPSHPLNATYLRTDSAKRELSPRNQRANTAVQQTLV